MGVFILLASPPIQIGDFGLSRDLNKENFYVSHGGKIPVKWTAPEALQYRLYSTASDVWSFGCVLYEIWSLGVKPYCHLTNSQVRLTEVPPPQLRNTDRLAKSG